MDVMLTTSFPKKIFLCKINVTIVTIFVTCM